MNIPILLTKKQFLEKHPAFTKGGMDMQLFHRKTNGMQAQGVIVRNGRRVLINEEKFFIWLESMQEVA